MTEVTVEEFAELMAGHSLEGENPTVVRMWRKDAEEFLNVLSERGLRVVRQ